MEAGLISSYAASAISILEHISRRAWSGATARIVRLPASATVLLLLVEGRPSGALLAPFFPPGASSPDGRQFSSGQASVTSSAGAPLKMAQQIRRPKWFVPGDGGSGLRLVLFSWTGLRFHFLFWEIGRAHV